VQAELRLEPDWVGKVPYAGALGSVQAGEVDVREPVSRLMGNPFLEWAGAAYWRVTTRFTLGLVRIASDRGDQCVVLIGRPLVLLRFHAPEYETGEERACVTWRIKRGILVSRDGRDRGWLRLSLEPLQGSGANGRRTVRVQMEVRNFYPWLRGAGAYSRIGVWIYAQTQQRIHWTVTRRFLRSVARAAAADQAGGGTSGSG
jgi:hypothetical protein